ncbi:MAG TPA: hypothetical protein VGN20_14980 [Mucilaginibacter sp.]|jgi:hypothetical protein
MNLKKTSSLLIVCVLFTACSRVYQPALYHQDIAYQPKPTSFDTSKTANYLSAGINAYSNYDLSDFLISSQFNLSRGHVFDNFNLAYGAFGVFGDYQNGTINKGESNYFSDKFFGAVGGRASANLFVTSGRADIRYLGVEVAYSHEFGGYADFRQSIGSSPNYFVDKRTDLFTVGITTEVIFHNRNDNGFQHGIRGFLGTTLGHNSLDDTYYADDYTPASKMFRNVFPKASYFIKFKNYFGTAEIGSQIFIRFGLKF